MPAFTICIGCGGRAAPNQNRCDACRALRPPTRRDSRNRWHEKTGEARRFYKSKAWTRARLAVLTRDAHTCVLCGKPAVVVDHDPPLLEQLAAGGTGVDLDSLRSLCRSCSGRVDGGRRRRRGVSLAGVGPALQTGERRADGNSLASFFGGAA